MAVFYNENEPFAAQWLRNLSAAGHIAPGRVDIRSIADIQPNDLEGVTQAHFFAGIGVWSKALRDAGWPDDLPVWTGSCPCQPFSVAGKGKGEKDERHLWPVWRDLIAECRPSVVFGEQASGAAGRAWLAAVRTEMEDLGYAFGAADLCAASVGAPHDRPRLYWGAALADADSGVRRWGSVVSLRYTSRGTVAGGHDALRHHAENPWRHRDLVRSGDGAWRAVEPGTLPVAHGPPARVGRLRGYGNAIVGQVAAQFILSFIEAAREL